MGVSDRLSEEGELIVEETSEASGTHESSEEISFEIIASAGQARSLAFEALQYARSNDFTKARELIEESKNEILVAHKCQTRLLTQEASGNHVDVDVLLVHAQDHLMTAQLARELIEEIINLYEIKADKEID
jgi:PTS system cellobiose-specific IIA component